MGLTPNPGVPICICLHPLSCSLLNRFHFLSLWMSSISCLSSCTLLIIINFQRYWTTFFYCQPSSHYDARYCKSQIQIHWWWFGEGGKNSDYVYLQNKFATATAEVFGPTWNVFFFWPPFVGQLLVLYVWPNFVCIVYIVTLRDKDVI